MDLPFGSSARRLAGARSGVTWDSFFTAEVGASAALAGLIFVSITINLQRIVANPSVTLRAFQALLLLVGTFVLATLLLVPGQSPLEQGAELLAVTLVLWGALNGLERAAWRRASAVYRGFLTGHSIQIQIPYIFAAIGSIALLRSSPSALYWYVPATLASFLIAIFEAWVLTIPILRLEGPGATPR
jgi:hypothetical protein